MGVRAALDAAPQHAWECHVGAEIGSAGDFVDAVGADGAGADDPERGFVEVVHVRPPVVRCGAGHGARGRGRGFAGTRPATKGLPAPGPLFSIPLIRWNAPCRQFRWAAVHHPRARATHDVRGALGT